MDGSVKPKYGEIVRLCYMVTDGFNANIKTDYIYKDLVEDVETRSGSSNFELDRPLPKGKNKNIGLTKD